MGISPFKASFSTYDYEKRQQKSCSIFGSKSYSVGDNNKLPNPDPKNYKINKYKHIKTFLIIYVTYPDCTNYEGKKILVFENCNLEMLKKQKSIDPHFCENKLYHSPIARFEPTERGWDMAVKFIESITKG